MDEPRDVQTSQRNDSRFRQLLSAGSAVAMEIKRKKIRQSTLFLQTEVMYIVHFVGCLSFRRSFLLSTFDRKVRSTPIPSSTFLTSNVTFAAVNDKITVGIYLKSFRSVNTTDTIILIPSFLETKATLPSLDLLSIVAGSRRCVLFNVAKRKLRMTTFSSSSV